MINHTVVSRKSKGQYSSRKTSSAIVRYTLIFVASLVLLPLVYVFQRIETREVIYSSPVHKNLKNFQPDDAPVIGSIQNISKLKRQKSVQLANDGRLILTAYLEPTDTLVETKSGPFQRFTTSDRLKKFTFPAVQNCSTLLKDFPVDAFPLTDPYLPWIHDYFPSTDGKFIQFVAQNRRRCDTGSDELDTMKFWEPQVSLFQRVPVVVTKMGGGSRKYRLASSFQEATHNATRFQCRFHIGSTTVTTLSIYPFDYDYITWRKGGTSMFDSHGKDTAKFWLSQLLFACPVPEEFQTLLMHSRSSRHLSVTNAKPVFHMDLIPIRTPPRTLPLLTVDQLGPDFSSADTYDLEKSFGRDQKLPNMDHAGRWQNLPICRRSPSSQLPLTTSGQSQSELDKVGEVATLLDRRMQKPYRLVACTWTSSSYTRRGDVVRVSDSAKRLNEWIHFHLMVGVDHVYIYDNTDTQNGDSTDLREVAESFGRDVVTYHEWPAKICNNNRPAHKNPGERSSQYGAESSCRTRYGDLTEWMTFLDTDEYLVPMKPSSNGEYNWRTVLDDMDTQNVSVMKFLSSRGKLRIELTEALEDQSICVDPVEVKGPNKVSTELCVGPMRNRTFLQVYNCEYIRPPKPIRFARAMKQIYRPSFVLSHFVHYSTVTSDMALSYVDYKATHNGTEPIMQIHDGRWEKRSPEMFVNELTQGALIHARSVLPHETRRRSSECYSGSKYSCIMGFLCEDDVEFVDALHQQNVFKNPDGRFCNCWRNSVVEDHLVPNLEKRLFNVKSR